MPFASHLPKLDANTLTALLADWRSQHPGAGVLALLPEAEAPHVGVLQQVCRNVELPLMGAIFPALIADSELTTQGALLLCFETCPPWTLAHDLDKHLGKGIKPITDLVMAHSSEAEQPTQRLFMIFDGMLPRIGTLLTGLFKTLGSTVHYSGVNAGSESFSSTDCLFDEHALIRNGAIALLLPDDAPLAVEHGYPVTRAIFRATSTEGNRIDQIDGKPAMQVYQELLKAEYGIAVSPENFYDYAVHFPFGLVSILDVLVRIPVGFNEDGAIYCVGEIPPNSSLRLLHAPRLEESACVDKIAATLGTGPGQLLAFYCAGRRMHFGPELTGHELAALQKATGASGLVGALSLGEISSYQEFGVPEFHNAAIIAERL